ncbi:MAG: class I adenylate cyclase [Succinatimonas sp.]|nr:class I adenylate cyclase [Succinatimonas sp.]
MDKIATDFDLRLSQYKLLNEERMRRALRVLRPHTRKMLNMLPLLLHYNDKRLPGARDPDVPYGIDGFVPNAWQRDYLKKQGIEPESRLRGRYSILGLYAMGSTSSICQGISSDLDIWVCVSSIIPEREILLLTEKCHFISTFFKTLGADINLFVTAEDRFISGQHGTLDTEDCGSAQSLFLLDEFYRSSFRLCGRYIIWYMVTPQEEDQDYYGAVQSLYESGRVDNQLWFDFGSVAKSSAAEYFGSGLWLLYKGIDHPFKAALKILLMEVYANEYPRTKLLSSVLKGRMYSSNGYSLRLDAYYLMFKKVTSYLKSKHDNTRLTLVRLCFYLKLEMSLVGLADTKVLNTRKKLLSRLCNNWGWSSSFREELKSREHWKAGFVTKLQTDLFTSLHLSYRALLRFSVGHGIEYAITSDDAGVLSRKLYAAFDGYPGKVLLLNREFCEYLEETDLTFINPSKNSICERGWHLYPAAINSLELLQRRAVYTALRLCQVVVWATFNHVLTARSKIYLGGSPGIVNTDKILSLSRDIKIFLGECQGQVAEADLQQTRYIRKTLVVVNFERDATLNYRYNSSEIDSGSALCAGRSRKCLIGSIDMITINSWGEIESTAFPDGEEGVVELLATLLRIRRLAFDRNQENFKSEVILSYSKTQRDLIRYDLESTLRGIFACIDNPQREYSFDVGLNTYVARGSGERGVSLLRRSPFSSSSYFDISVLSRYGMRPEFALQVPAEIDREASIGVIQYFFAKAKKGWDIYIVNERNEVKTVRGYQKSRSDLVNAINRFYTRQSEETSGERNLHFNLPQYFVLSDNMRSLHPFTIKSGDKKN